MQKLELDTSSFNIWQRFHNAYVNGILPKALLLINSFGVIDNLLVNWMQALLVCSNKEAPCFKCKNCKLALQGIHPDIDIILNKEDKLSIGIEVVRELQEHLYLTPQCAKSRVVYFADLERLTVPAFESLLKILEEPPETVFFIAKTTSLQKILPTVLSRFQRWVFASPKSMPSNYIDYAISINLLKDTEVVVDDLQAAIENKLCIYMLAEKWSAYNFAGLVDLLYCLLAQMIKLKFRACVDNDNIVIAKLTFISNQFSIWLLMESFMNLVNISKQLKTAIPLNAVLSLEIWLQNLFQSRDC